MQTLVVPGDMGTCVECGHRWVAAGAGEAWEFELQRSRGDQVEGPFDRLTLREMVYTGRLTGTELVRAPGQTHFKELRQLPEFHEVLVLIGAESAESRGEHRISGWKVAPSKEKPAPVLATPPPAPVEKKGRSPIVVVGVLLVVAAVMFALLLLSPASGG